MEVMKRAICPRCKHEKQPDKWKYCDRCREYSRNRWLHVEKPAAKVKRYVQSVAVIGRPLPEPVQGRMWISNPHRVLARRIWYMAIDDLVEVNGVCVLRTAECSYKAWADGVLERTFSSPNGLLSELVLRVLQYAIGMLDLKLDDGKNCS